MNLKSERLYLDEAITLRCLEIMRLPSHSANVLKYSYIFSDESMTGLTEMKSKLMFRALFFFLFFLILSEDVLQFTIIIHKSFITLKLVLTLNRFLIWQQCSYYLFWLWNWLSLYLLEDEVCSCLHRKWVKQFQTYPFCPEVKVCEVKIPGRGDPMLIYDCLSSNADHVLRGTGIHLGPLDHDNKRNPWFNTGKLIKFWLQKYVAITCRNYA